MFIRMPYGLPLLTKDLIEQAAQRRTYVLRVIYAVVLYSAALWVYADVSGKGAQSGITNLGRGQQVFEMLLSVQTLAIFILLPGMTCGAVTSEKERDTLGLLLLTKLSPATIVLEKYCSRLVTMGTYQLLSLPLFAITYGMGGVELGQIIRAIWFLACLTAIVGAWSLSCSVWHSTTTGAFIYAYMVVPVALPFAWVALVDDLGATALQMIMTLIITAIILVVAAELLVPRAFVPPRNVLLELFKKLDKFFEELNAQTTHGIVLVRDFDSGPLFSPISWRETRKKSLGTFRYLFRLLVVLEAPLILSISWTITDYQMSSFDGPTAFFLRFLWPVAVLAITVHATSVLASERSRQTLDVLLVTPLSPHELVSQKLAGVRRLIYVVSVPLASLLVFQFVWTSFVLQGLGQVDIARFLLRYEILGMALGLVVYPRIVQWISFQMALRVKNQTLAILFTLLIVVAICVLPYGCTYLLVREFNHPSLDPRIDWMNWLSPIRILFFRRVGDLSLTEQGSAWLSGWMPIVGIAFHALVFGSLLWVLRFTALRNFSRILGRAEPQEVIR